MHSATVRALAWLVAILLLLVALSVVWPADEGSPSAIVTSASPLRVRDELTAERTTDARVDAYLRAVATERARQENERRATLRIQRAGRSTASRGSEPTSPPTTAGAIVSEDEVTMPALLRRIGGCESSGRPDGPLVWTADNPRSSASGAFGILDSTWRGWTKVYSGEEKAWQWSRALHAPASVQTVVAVRAFTAQGTRPWLASAGCWR